MMMSKSQTAVVVHLMSEDFSRFSFSDLELIRHGNTNHPNARTPSIIDGQKG